MSKVVPIYAFRSEIAIRNGVKQISCLTLDGFTMATGFSPSPYPDELYIKYPDLVDLGPCFLEEMLPIEFKDKSLDNKRF